MKHANTLCCTLLASAALACSTPSSSEPAPASSPSGPSTAASEPRAALPPDTAPAATAEQPSASELAFTPAPGWIVETPSSAMRKAQYRLPHADSDSEDASLVVYYFGGQGGSVQANIERWVSQFEQPDGRDSQDVLQSSTRTVNGMEATEVELSGTYVAETSPGSGERLRKEGWRMLAVILQAKEGPYYLKLVGPEATVARWEQSFRAFVEAVAPSGS
jgi:hypothetical protein